MKYLFIELKDGKRVVMNDQDELGGLIDNEIPHRTIGTVCDNREYGDNCNTDCLLFRKGTCPSVPMRDSDGDLWHVLRYTED